jgi:hypothetical protein
LPANSPPCRPPCGYSPGAHHPRIMTPASTGHQPCILQCYGRGRDSIARVVD